MGDFKIPTLKCKRCDHQWIPRSPNKPKVCPKCNSPYWDKERGWYDMRKEKEKQKKKDAEEIGELTELSYDLKGQ